MLEQALAEREAEAEAAALLAPRNVTAKPRGTGRGASRKEFAAAPASAGAEENARGEERAAGEAAARLLTQAARMEGGGASSPTHAMGETRFLNGSRVKTRETAKTSGMRAPDARQLYEQVRRARETAGYGVRRTPREETLRFARGSAAAPLPGAAEFDLAFQRDARRYDGGYVLF